ncbi:unnamed protein product [Protopolystoma xenopodis]|uniref:Fibronectin type-III domain-containing protein n=1 Tax=Protopolystoma xenopodis TaxID=117903 RepID=A0A3S5CD70_9PLAT|nr:unnamed protein product [Protopolystoma xenopodis]
MALSLRDAPSCTLDWFNENEIHISWTPIPSEATEAITYTVEVTKDNGHWWRPVASQLSEHEYSIPVELADPLYPLQIRVLAENSLGQGPASTPALRVPIRACLPVMPMVKPTITEEDATSVRISWQAACPTQSTTAVSRMQVWSDGSKDWEEMSPLKLLGRIRYKLEVRESVDMDWRCIASDLDDREYVYHLRPGVTTMVRVCAINRYGTSEASPAAIISLNIGRLIPDLSIDPPWVTVIRSTSILANMAPTPKSAAVEAAKARRRLESAEESPNVHKYPSPAGLLLHWKPAYMPDFCAACVAGLEPVYSVEWRRGRTGQWQMIVDDLEDITSFRLPNEVVHAVAEGDDGLEWSKELSGNREPFRSALYQGSHHHLQPVEVRVSCRNAYGNSGPTRACRLSPSQLLAGTHRPSLTNCFIPPVSGELEASAATGSTLSTTTPSDMYSDLPVLQLPSSLTRLKVNVTSISMEDGCSLEWQPYLTTGLANSTGPKKTNNFKHRRYRLEKFLCLVPSSLNSEYSEDAYNPLADQANWNIHSRTEGLIFGENFVLDIKPEDSQEQLFRLLAWTQRPEDGQPAWQDAYEYIRVPSRLSLRPQAPCSVTVTSVQAAGTNGNPGLRVSWTPSEQHMLIRPPDGTLKSDIGTTGDEIMYSEVESFKRNIEAAAAAVTYRVEARSLQTTKSSWRQVAMVTRGVTSVLDRHAQPGVRLIYRVTPINGFGDGPSTESQIIFPPPAFASLNRLIQIE